MNSIVQFLNYQNSISKRQLWYHSCQDRAEDILMSKEDPCVLYDECGVVKKRSDSLGYLLEYHQLHCSTAPNKQLFIANHPC